MNGTTNVTGRLNVGSNANIYFLLILVRVKSFLPKLYKRNFKKGIAI